MYGEIKDFAGACWTEVLSLAKDAAVYIDHAASECLHWYTGDKAYLTLKNSGAVSVHELALYNFHNLRAIGVTKAVVISTSTDSLFYHKTLKLIIEKNVFEQCFVICTAHKSILNYTSGGNDILKKNSYETLKDDVLNWMNDKAISKKSQVSMIFKPIFIACLKNNIFVTPPFGNLIPSIDGVLLDDYEMDTAFLTSSFYTLFNHYKVQSDIYYMGKCSKYVAEKMLNFTNATDKVRVSQLKPDRKKVSLIFVDRFLDLSTASSHDSKSILGRILRTLPHLPNHQNDVAVQMDSFSVKGELCTSSFMVPGCIANANEEVMNILFYKKHKELLVTLNNLLINMSKASPKTKKISTRISVHSLEKGIQKFRDTESIESLCDNSKNLQLIAAVVQALKSTKTAQIEFIISLEKLILQNLAVSGDSSSILSQLSNIIKTRNTRGLHMDSLLVLLVYLYAMAGPDIKFSDQQEKTLKEALTEALFEDISKCDETDLRNELSTYYETLLLLGVTDEENAKEASVRITNRIMHLLHKVFNQRLILKKYKQVINKPNSKEMARHIGILEQLMIDLLDEKRPEIPDLIKMDTLPDSLSHPINEENHPCNNSWIIIYFLGGITPDEVNVLEDILCNKGADCPKITLGGTRLLNQFDLVDKILLANIINI